MSELRRNSFCSKSISRAGIYLIRHKPTGSVYVGQSNNIKKRWGAHQKQIKARNHHNENLRKLSEKCGENDFQYEIIVEAPRGLTPLQMQRWLIKEERKAYEYYKSQGLALNIAEPEIVPTPAAIEEYKQEREDNRKKHDKAVSAKRKQIKTEINKLRKMISPEQRRLHEIRWQYEQKIELIKKSTGWRRLFYGRPQGFDLKAEKRIVQDMENEINRLSPKVYKVESKIYKLEREYRELYSQFSKVADRRLRASYFRILGRFPSETVIAE